MANTETTVEGKPYEGLNGYLIGSASGKSYKLGSYRKPCLVLSR